MDTKEVVAMRSFEYSPDGFTMQRLTEGQRFAVRTSLLAGLEQAGYVRVAGDKDKDKDQGQGEQPAVVPEVEGDPAQNESQPILDPDEPSVTRDPPGAEEADQPKTTKAKRGSRRLQA